MFVMRQKSQAQPVFRWCKRTESTEGSVLRFILTANEEQLLLQLPVGWLNEHYLRASELHQEAERQSAMGWPTLIEEADI